MFARTAEHALPRACAQVAFGAVDGFDDVALDAAPLPRPGPSPACAACAVARCLVYLGDLARYISLHAPGDNAGKDWGAARSYYAAAARLQPGNGNPFNQLAVVATYTNAALRAAYCYARAQAAPQPFVTARDNLGLLLRDVPAPQPRTTPAAAAAEAFVRALGALFTRSSECGAAVAAALAALDAALASPPAAAALLAWSPDGVAPPALYMAAVALCCERTAAWAAPGAGALPAQAAAASATLLFGLTARLLRRAAAEAAAPPPRAAALPAALPLLEWAAASPADAAPPPAPPPAEAAARAAAWAAAAALLNALQEAGADAAAPHAHAARADALCAAPEDFELRGLLLLSLPHAALRFGTHREWAAAVAAAAAGESGAAARARAQRALAAGLRIASAAASQPLLRSPATGRFTPVVDPAAAAAAAGLPWPPPSPAGSGAADLGGAGAAPNDSFGALIEPSPDAEADMADAPLLAAAAALQPPELEAAGAAAGRITWRPQRPAGAGAAEAPSSFSLFAMQPPAAPPPLPSAALLPRAPPPAPPSSLLAGLGGSPSAARPAQPGFAGVASMGMQPSVADNAAAARWTATFVPHNAPDESALPLPFPGLLAAAQLAPPPAPPPGACPPARPAQSACDASVWLLWLHAHRTLHLCAGFATPLRTSNPFLT